MTAPCLVFNFVTPAQWTQSWIVASLLVSGDGVLDRPLKALVPRIRSIVSTLRLPVRRRPAVPRTTAPTFPPAASAAALLHPGRRSPLLRPPRAAPLPGQRAGRGVSVPRPRLPALAPPLCRRTPGKLSTASGAAAFLLYYPCEDGGTLLHNAFTRLFPLSCFNAAAAELTKPDHPKFGAFRSKFRKRVSTGSENCCIHLYLRFN